MNKILPALLLLLLAIFLCSCPYDSPYNIDEEPLEQVDEQLLGNWTTLVSKPGKDLEMKQEPINLSLNKRTDKEYDLTISGNMAELRPYHPINNDSITGTAYISSLAGRQFFNAYIQGKVYIAELVKDSNAISILPLAEHFTSKLIKNSRELRTAIEFHYRMRLNPGYDRLFALRSLKKLH